MAPNPATGADLRLHFALTGPAESVRIRVMTPSARVILNRLVPAPAWPGDQMPPLSLSDALGTPLANGNYHYLVEALEGGSVADSAAGSFFVLR